MPTESIIRPSIVSRPSGSSMVNLNPTPSFQFLNRINEEVNTEDEMILIKASANQTRNQTPMNFETFEGEDKKKS